MIQTELLTIVSSITFHMYQLIKLNFFLRHLTNKKLFGHFFLVSSCVYFDLFVYITEINENK